MTIALPLTPFEYYYLSDDRPGYPMTFPCDMRFNGVVQREPFLTALGQTIDRHPLLDAQLDEQSSWPRWIVNDRSTPIVDWADESVPITPLADGSLEPADRARLRLWVRTGPERSRILMRFHHACCDGLAAFRFIEDMLSHYALALRIPENVRRQPDLDITKLLARGQIGGPANRKPNLAIGIRDIGITIWEWSRILVRIPALLAAPKPTGNGSPTESRPGAPSTDGVDAAGPDWPLLDFLSEQLSGEHVGKLRHVAGTQGVTLNELLLRDMFFAIRDWNRQNAGDSRKRFWLNVPVSIRGRDDLAGPAANRIGFAFVPHDPRQPRDRGESLASVHREMERIKQRKSALFFLGGLGFACNFRGVVPWALRRNRAFATMVASNIGRIFAGSPLVGPDGRLRCGNLVLERVAGVPPIRPLTRAAVAVFEYAGEMTINLRCDPLVFRAGDTRALLDLYLHRLGETMQTGT